MRNRTSDLRIPRSDPLSLSHRLHRERGLLRNSYDTRPAYCEHQLRLSRTLFVIYKLESASKHSDLPDMLLSASSEKADRFQK